MVYKSLFTRYTSAILKIVVGKMFCVSLSAELQPFQSLQKQYLILSFVNDPGFQKSLFLAGKQYPWRRKFGILSLCLVDFISTLSHSLVIYVSPKIDYNIYTFCMSLYICSIWWLNPNHISFFFHSGIYAVDGDWTQNHISFFFHSGRLPLSIQN